MEPKFLINTITAWNEPHRARHQFAFAASKQYKIVFVTRNNVGLPKLRISNPEPNITLIEPCFPVDYRFRYRLPFINEMYQHWLYPKLKKLYPDISVVNFDFTATQLFKSYSSAVYYCNDEYVGNSKYQSRLVDKYIASCERKVASKAIFCVATAGYLVNKLKKYNPNSFEIPLGVSVSNSTSIPVKIHKKKKIVVGLMGIINKRKISLNAINQIIKDPRFFLVLIGPIEKSFLKKLQHTDNIKVTGLLKGNALSEELEKLDVGVALYNLKRINPGTTPNKMWQYLCHGKPVVVSNLPNLKGIKLPEKTVYILKNEDNLIETIMRALTEDNSKLYKQRIAFAKKNTWDHRFNHFMILYKKYLIVKQQA